MKTTNGIKIKYVIGIFVTAAILMTVLTEWYASSRQFKENLTESRLEQNYDYTQNVVNMTSTLLNDMKRNIRTLARVTGEEEFSQADLDNWLEANSHYYNSLFTTDEHGFVGLMSPQAVPNNPNQVQPGTQITSDLMKKTLKEQQPFISDPYFSQTGNLMLLISYPLFDENGEYRGVVDGTIYLEGESSLQRMLNNHEFLGDTTVFVVDRTGRIIYHPDSSKIDENVDDHPMIEKVMQGNSGAEQVINHNDETFFSAYGYIEEAGWTVITQTPTSVIAEPLNDLRREMIGLSLPVLAIFLILAWILATRLGSPLAQLSRHSREAMTTKKIVPMNRHIKSAVHEIRELEKDIQRHIELLHAEIQLDGLTKLYNRRAFNLKVQELIDDNKSFSLILLDIDHFKKVNDKYGHLVGDEVLQFLASLIKEMSQGKYICFRYGGEEFALIGADEHIDLIYRFAEEIREKVANTASPTGEPIEISLGISTHDIDEDDGEKVINQADIALYHSKNNGRNQTTLYRDRSRECVNYLKKSK